VATYINSKVKEDTKSASRTAEEGIVRVNSDSLHQYIDTYLLMPLLQWPLSHLSFDAVYTTLSARSNGDPGTFATGLGG
jgi:hypothetical protein